MVAKYKLTAVKFSISRPTSQTYKSFYCLCPLSMVSSLIGFVTALTIDDKSVNWRNLKSFSWCKFGTEIWNLSEGPATHWLIPRIGSRVRYQMYTMKGLNTPRLTQWSLFPFSMVTVTSIEKSYFWCSFCLMVLYLVYMVEFKKNMKCMYINIHTKEKPFRLGSHPHSLLHAIFYTMTSELLNWIVPVLGTPVVYNPDSGRWKGRLQEVMSKLQTCYSDLFEIIENPN